MTGKIYTDQVPPESNDLQRTALERLTQAGIHYRVMPCEAAVSIAECEAVGRALGVRLIKNLLVSNRQGTRFHLVTMPGEKPFVTRAFTAGRGVSRVSFVSADKLMSMLSTPVGGAGPLSLLADAEGKVEAVIDAELDADAEVAVPVFSPCMYAAIRLRDLSENLLPAIGHPPVTITMADPEPPDLYSQKY